MSEETPVYNGIRKEVAKRDNVIKVRVSDDELAVLHANKKRTELARWIREVALASGQGDMLDELLPPAVEPALLRQLAGIGNNVNQIARALHRTGIEPDARIHALATLVSIEAELKALRLAYTAQ